VLDWCKKQFEFHKILQVLLRFLQNKLLNILFSSTFKKGQKMAKWPNYFISGKQFKKGQIRQFWPLKMPNGYHGTVMYWVCEVGA